MKNLTWQHVTLFGLLMAAVIGAHAFVPAAALAVDTLVSTVLGFVAKGLITNGDSKS